MAKHKSGHHEPSKGNPDKGISMAHGQYTYDRGYTEDHGNDSAYMPEAHMRGNNYPHLQNEIKHRDMKKLVRGKFTKIA